MNKYLGLYNTHSEFNNGALLLKEPYVAICKDENHIHYGPQTPFNGHDYVDLGLPSGTLWATCNVGANSPEGPGDIFAWGETEPYYSNLDPLTWKDGKEEGYNLSSYKFYNNDSYTKYNNEDKLTVLDLEDDAVHVNWGGSWRIPTSDNFLELKNYCTKTWTQLNNVNGYLLTGINGNSIFLPTTYNTALKLDTYQGWYWTSSMNQYLNVYYVSIDPDFISNPSSGTYRYSGRSVRGVITSLS